VEVDMPDLSLDTSLHTNMLKRHYKMLNHRSMPRRLYSAVRRELSGTTYGLQWGDPETLPPLRFVKDRWVTPYVHPDETGLEIGPGGGRWTRYLLGFETLYAVDYYQELLDELRKNIPNRPNVVFVKNNGTDFPSVPDNAVDYIFSFGTFVHLQASVIDAYLGNLGRILKSGGNAVIQYSDKTKVMARENPAFSQNTPDEMRAMVTRAGFRIVEEDVTTLWHSSLIRFTH
jgi:ubiquinone/menaquinone biosynthesis C-methylase UbiE